MPTITDWLMVLLTFIYLGATIAIYRANFRSANAAAKQLEEMKNTQRQNVRLQLFDKGYDTYKSLSSWLDVPEEVFSNRNSDPEIEYDNRADVFDFRVFGTYQRPNIKNTNKLIAHIKEIRAKIEREDLTEKERTELSQTKENLEERLNNHRNELSRYIESLDSVNDEFHKIDLSEFIFSGIDSEKINCFANAFSNMVKTDSLNNLQALENACKAINKEEMLQIMRKQLKILEVNIECPSPNKTMKTSS